MRNALYGKGMVLATICLFIGAGVFIEINNGNSLLTNAQETIGDNTSRAWVKGWDVDYDSQWFQATNYSINTEIDGSGPNAALKLTWSWGSWQNIWYEPYSYTANGFGYETAYSNTVDCSGYDEARFSAYVRGDYLWDDGSIYTYGYVRFSGTGDVFSQSGTSYYYGETSIPTNDYGLEYFEVAGSGYYNGWWWTYTDGTGTGFKIQGRNKDYDSSGSWVSNWKYLDLFCFRQLSLDVDSVGGGLKVKVECSDDASSVKDDTGWMTISSTGDIDKNISSLDNAQYCRVSFNLTEGSTPSVDEFEIYGFTEPTVLTNPADVLSPYSAILNGEIDEDGGWPCIGWFEWGLTESYGNTTSSIPGLLENDDYYRVISDLEPNTMYHYRAVANNSFWTDYGEDQTLITEVAAPTVSTNTPTAVTNNFATLKGYLNDDGGQNCTAFFRWGKTSSYGNNTPMQYNKQTGNSFYQTISSLLHGTTYHYRAVAANSQGTSYGDDMNFTTKAPPVADFNYTPLSPTTADTIDFTDNSTDSDGGIVNWTWDFDDGNNSYEQNPTHQYLSAGNYTVCLIVKDNDNLTNTTCNTITVIGVDVNQSTFNRGFPIRHAIDGDWGAAQNFTPTLDTLTSVDIYLRKFGTPEFNLTVELRTDDPQGTLIDTLVFTPSEVPSSWEWFTLDFTDISVTPGTDYFIVCPPAPSGVTTSFGYEWGYAFGDQYWPGSFWFTRDGGGLWRDLPTMYEFCFRTYGYS